jgi:hypothetical protein
VTRRFDLAFPRQPAGEGIIDRAGLKWMAAALLIGQLAACEDRPPPFNDTADVLGLPLCMFFFKLDSVEPQAGGRDYLQTCATHLKEFPADKRFAIESFTDRAGSEAHNLALSQRRADGVKAGLVGRGLSPSSLDVRALGESKPLVQTADGVREPQNRRIEIREACPGGMDGVGPGGTPNCR